MFLSLSELIKKNDVFISIFFSKCSRRGAFDFAFQMRSTDTFNRWLGRTLVANLDLMNDAQQMMVRSMFDKWMTKYIDITLYYLYINFILPFYYLYINCNTDSVYYLCIICILPAYYLFITCIYYTRPVLQVIYYKIMEMLWYILSILYGEIQNLCLLSTPV